MCHSHRKFSIDIFSLPSKQDFPLTCCFSDISLSYLANSYCKSGVALVFTYKIKGLYIALHTLPQPPCWERYLDTYWAAQWENCATCPPASLQPHPSLIPTSLPSTPLPMQGSRPVGFIGVWGGGHPGENPATTTTKCMYPRGPHHIPHYL